MTQEDFKRLIEAPINQADDKVFAKYTVARTMRLTLEHIELAREWYDALPKVIPDKEKISVSKIF